MYVNQICIHHRYKTHASTNNKNIKASCLNTKTHKLFPSTTVFNIHFDSLAAFLLTFSSFWLLFITILQKTGVIITYCEWAFGYLGQYFWEVTCKPIIPGVDYGINSSTQNQVQIWALRKGFRLDPWQRVGDWIKTLL